MNANGRWAGGDAYERYIGRWSRPVGAAFVDWLDVAPDRAWLDLGCGTGGLTATVLERAEPGRVIGVDPSASFVEHARAHVIDPRAAFVVGSADALPIDDDSVDVAVSGLVLNFVPDVAAALRGLRRVVRPDGLIGAYVWDYAGRMDLIRRFWDAAVGLDPGARELDEGVRFPICAPDALRAAFVSAGLSDVDVRAIDAPTRFADVDDCGRRS